MGFPDWKGTAQLDERMTGKSIYETTGVDFDEWTIIGLDIGGGESGVHDLEIVVVPRGTDLSAPRIEADHLMVHGVDGFEALKSMMHVFEMRFRIRRLEDTEIVITKRGDIPPQD